MSLFSEIPSFRIFPFFSPFPSDMDNASSVTITVLVWPNNSEQLSPSETFRHSVGECVYLFGSKTQTDSPFQGVTISNSFQTRWATALIPVLFICRATEMGFSFVNRDPKFLLILFQEGLQGEDHSSLHSSYGWSENTRVLVRTVGSFAGQGKRCCHHLPLAVAEAQSIVPSPDS